ncbi:hypothetical protein L1049_010841 [Liquidambar formosana]|uniref:Uncharacterized protein n=1 Tax=Liquidambar formosana TaxID=63359 RepID=A0AAP0WXQ0_LIQFO
MGVSSLPLTVYGGGVVESCDPIAFWRFVRSLWVCREAFVLLVPSFGWVLQMQKLETKLVCFFPSPSVLSPAYSDGEAIVTKEDGMESLAHRFLSAAVKLDRKPSKCVVFEDDPRGITAAHN